LNNNVGYTTENDVASYLSDHNYVTTTDLSNAGYLTSLPAHTHTKSDITDFSHTHAYSEITGTPTIPQIPSNLPVSGNYNGSSTSYSVNVSTTAPSTNDTSIITIVIPAN